MSMILGLTTVSDANLSRILSDPPLVWQLLAPDDPEMYEAARTDTRPRGLSARLFSGLKRHQQAVPDLVLAPGEGEDTDLDKAWQGLHYLFTGTAWAGQGPLSFLLCGGQEIGDIEVGYGPARAFAAAEARQIQEALTAVADGLLRERFNPEDMMAKEIYPQIWTRDPGDDDALGYLLAYGEVLRGCVAKIVGQRFGFVVSIQ